MAAAVLIATLFVVITGRVAAADGSQLAAGYKFTALPIAFPADYNRQPMKTVRDVNPAYRHLRAWISSVGAGVAINDLTGHGRDDGMCIVDTRTNDVVVTYTPTAPPADRFSPFVLNAAPLPMDNTMAPMGCTPGDFNGDGRMDLLVTYWGRVPIVFLARAGVSELSANAYRPQELIPTSSTGGSYRGPRWNTNAVSIGDFAGDGHPDLFIGNYFPNSDVLDPNGLNNVQMNSSLSNARNGGGDYVLRWLGGTSGADPTVSYEPEPDAIPYEASTGWTLAAASADLTGRGLPDLYVANDFGNDYLLHNVSTPGHIRFIVATGQRTPTTPKSFVLGRDSFKGMGVDFDDFDDNGRFDIMVSNISTSWGLEESNFVWMNQATSDADMQRDLDSGIAPFTQQARRMGMAWTGWSWDVKAADFRNTGNLDVVQTDGFVKGDIDRWPWLQELAMTNDDLLTNPANWPNVQPGDDIAGKQGLAFYARTATGTYVNIGSRLGLAVPTPTRGVAIGDTTGGGAFDFAVARQWAAPVFYANQSPDLGNYLSLRLFRPADSGTVDALSGVGTPAYGTAIELTTPDGRHQISQLDGGGGHTGKRSFEVHFGLGATHGSVAVHLSWRDLNGELRQQDLRLAPGTHTLMLTDQAQEVPSR